MIAVLATILAVFVAADSNDTVVIAEFPDEMSCGAALEYVIHDAVCSTPVNDTAPVFSPRPKRNPIYEN